MSSNLDQIMKLDVPIIVRLAERQLPLGEVLRLVPGAIIELDKSSDGELDLLVNNRVIGSGTAVKVGENFGIRVTYLGNLKEREDKQQAASEELSAADAARLADELLAGQV
jgi:flagellar motor switch protein FliN/FliY